MTILYPDRFTQARPAGFDGVFDWDFLKGAFGPSIMPNTGTQVKRRARITAETHPRLIKGGAA